MLINIIVFIIYFIYFFIFLKLCYDIGSIGVFLMERIEELEALIEKSKSECQNICHDYSLKVAEVTKSLKEEYIPKIKKKMCEQKDLYNELFYFYRMMRFVDNFDMDVIGKVLAELLTQTTGVEYTYDCLGYYSSKSSLFVSGYAATLYPKGKIIIDENMCLGVSCSSLLEDRSIFVLEPFVNTDDKQKINFYSYVLEDSNNCDVRINSDLVLEMKKFPQVKKFIDFVIGVHIEDRKLCLKQISEEELKEELEIFLNGYEGKKLIKKPKE